MKRKMLKEVFMTLRFAFIKRVVALQLVPLLVLWMAPPGQTPRRANDRFFL